MRVPAESHDRRSRPARRTCRTSAPLVDDRRQDRVRRSAVGRRSPGDRSLGVRVAEMGAADGGRRGGVCRHHAACRARRYTALVPNQQGLERAIAAGVSEVAIFAAASETFSRRNINQSIDESLATYAAVCADAQAAGLRVRGYLSTCFVCPFEGPVDPQRVADISARLLDIGVYEVAISDTIGAAHPGHGAARARCASPSACRSPQIALHFHDTRGTALANVLAGLDYGVTTFDSSAGGLGGCPFAPGAAGNLATEDLLFMLNGLGVETGVSIDGVAAASRAIETQARSQAAVALPASADTLNCRSEIWNLTICQLRVSADPSGRGLGTGCRLLARRLQGGLVLRGRALRLSCLEFPCPTPRSQVVTRCCLCRRLVSESAAHRDRRTMRVPIGHILYAAE